jgi:hypothetical protein
MALAIFTRGRIKLMANDPALRFFAIIGIATAVGLALLAATHFLGFWY